MKCQLAQKHGAKGALQSGRERLNKNDRLELKPVPTENKTHTSNATKN